MRSGLIVALILLMLPGLAGAAGIGNLRQPWPEGDGVNGTPITFPSSSPFSLIDVGKGEADPPTTATGTLFMPGTTAAAPVPAVVLLHGAAGVRGPRELTYARQFATLGIAAIVVDAFGARRDRASNFTERLLEITEAMVLADAYAALRHLAAMPQIDPRRIAVMGFSYGGMAATYAAYRQVADSYAPNGPRFAAHIAFYGPCIARFDNPRTTGAPLLMLYGGRDQIIDQAQCRLVADDLRKGGSPVETILYEDAYHQWDGGPSTPWRAGTNIAGCRFAVASDGATRDTFSGLAMSGPLTRRAILVLCADRDGYLVGRDDAIRVRSNAAVGTFLERAFGG